MARVPVDLGDMHIADEGFGLVGYEEPEVVPRFKEILRGAGTLLSLDLSVDSTGVAFHTKEDGLVTWNLSLKATNKVHAEAEKRLQLKAHLLESFRGKSFDVIIVEDVFGGANMQTYRMLCSLNTVIDELILEGHIKCETFLRIQNGVWKKWLRALSNADLRHLKDKELIETALFSIDYSEVGKGYQDRLDAAGMVIGYWGSGRNDEAAGKKKITMTQVEYAYSDVEETLLYGVNDAVLEKETIYIPNRSLSESIILKFMNENPEALYQTENPVHIGRLATELGMHLPKGGYAAFWKKEK